MPVTLNELAARLGLDLLPEAEAEYASNARRDIQARLNATDTDKQLRSKFDYEALALDCAILQIFPAWYVWTTILAPRGQALDDGNRYVLGGVGLAHRLSVIDVILIEADRRRIVGLHEELAARADKTVGGLPPMGNDDP